MAVYRIDPDGSVHQIVTDAGKPKGVAISPDEKTLYLVSNDKGRPHAIRNGTSPSTKGVVALLAYDLDAEGRASKRRVLVDYAPEDGLVANSEGNLRVAVRNQKRPGIYAYTPKGEEKADIPTTIPTDVPFGSGEDADLLSITADSSLDRIRVGKKGHHVQK